MPPKKRKAKKPKATMSQNVKQSVVVHVNTSKTTRRQPTRSGNRSQVMSRIQTPQFVGVVGQDYSTYNNQLNNITQAIANAIKQPDRTGNLITTPPRQAPDEPIHTAPSVVNIETRPSMDAIRQARLSRVQSPASPLSSTYTPSSPPPYIQQAPPKEESKVKASTPTKTLDEDVDEISGSRWDDRRAEEQPKSKTKSGRKPYTEEQKQKAAEKRKEKIQEEKANKARAKANAKEKEEEAKAKFIQKRKETIAQKEQEAKLEAKAKKEQEAKAKAKAKKEQGGVLSYFKK
jgi:hypothetical protein